MIWDKYDCNNKNKIQLDPSVVVKKVRPNDPNIRRPVAGSLGLHIEGAVCPHPDLSDTNTTLEGALYRFCPLVPGYDLHKPEFKNFVKNWCEKNLTPLRPDTDLTVESWLSTTNYTIKRKEELLMKFNKITNKFDEKHRVVKSFIKDEFYPEYKHARAINSRSDEFKTLTGPIFQKIGDVLFSRPEFIKKIPIHLRPQYLLDRHYKDGAEYMSTDFSSFEAHFTRQIMEDCEFVMYEHMTQYLAEGPDFMRLVREVIGGKNYIQFKNVLMEIDAKRMSGEMNTSSGNGFSNLMFIQYICSLYPEVGEVTSTIEGDDSLSTVTGKCPTTEMFAQFGLRIKIEKHIDLCTASFCGMVFDVDERCNVSDPREVLATFGWTTNKYIKSKKNIKMCLLRCKALSLAYQYPSCPILSALAERVLFLTRSFTIDSFVKKQGSSLYNQYDIELYLAANEYYKQKTDKNGHKIFAEPGPKTRALVEKLYGITISEQIHIETYLSSIELEPINDPVILSHMPKVWCDYYEKYHAKLPVNSSILDYPGVLWPAVRADYDYSQLLPRGLSKT